MVMVLTRTLQLVLRHGVEDGSVVLERVVSLRQGVGEEAGGVGLEQVVALRQPSVNLFYLNFLINGG